MSSLTELLSNLQVYSKSDSHSQVFNLGLSILKKDKTNLLAFKKCLIALINLDKYTTASDLLKSHKDLASNDTDLLIEKAYIYYKLNDSESLSQLVDAGTNVRAFQHILAQHYYRIGRTEQSLEIYQKLLSTRQSDESLVDLSVNERAVLSQLKKLNGTAFLELESTNAPAESYDVTSNDALIKINEGDYEGAMVLLKKAYSQCKTAMEDYDDDEKFDELTPIEIQIAYTKQLLNQNEEAQSILNKFDLSAITDSVFKLLISNNLLSLSNDELDDKNQALLYRELQLPNVLNLALDKLTLPQLKTLERNEIILAFKAGKTVGKSARTHQDKFSDSLLPSALNTLSKIRDFSVDDLTKPSNERTLFKYARSNPENLAITLLAVQFSINANKLQNACLLLENAIQHDITKLTRPSVICLILSLYDQLERKNSKFELLTKVSDKLLTNTESFDIEDLKFLKFIAFQTMSFDEETSDKLFSAVFTTEKLMKNNDPLVTAIMDPTTTMESLGPIEPLIQSVDVDQLISQGLEPLLTSKLNFKSSSKSSSSSSARAAKLAAKQRSKIAKKQRTLSKRLPKDLTKKIDEERWLPLKDRSYYKPKKGKKGKDTQGGAIDASAEQALNISNINSSPAPASASKKSTPAKRGKKKGKK